MRIMTAGAALALLGSLPAHAAISDAEFNELKAQLNAMAQRVGALEAENTKLRTQTTGVMVEDLAATKADVAALKAQSQSGAWADKVAWKGDFRYRYEEIGEDGKDDRSRHRVRARAALVAKPASNIEVGLGMATGGDDPVSTNQTLGGGGSTKDIRLDQAYARWTPTKSLYLQGGKYKNVWYVPQKSALIYDGDFRPEGISAGWRNDNFFATLTGNWLESDSKSGDKSVYGVQVGASFGMLSAAVGYLDIPTAGLEAIYDDDFFGNSAVDGAYLFNYELVTFGANLALELAELPLAFYVDYVNNQDADDLDTGYIVGAKLGKAKKQGSWQVQYQYQDLEKDATLGLITDSDFGGGGTDSKGHKLSGKYAFNNKWTLGFTYFDNEIDVSDPSKRRDYDRLMIDTAFKY